MSPGAAARVDAGAVARDAAALVAVPSVTGDEHAALECLAGQATALGLDADLHRHPLDALRTHPSHPGEEAARDELWGLTVTSPVARRRRADGETDHGARRRRADGETGLIAPSDSGFALRPPAAGPDDGFAVCSPEPASSRRRHVRIALCGHVDVVPVGSVAWRHGPWSGVIEDGELHGRGSVDMKGAVVAALHALAAVSVEGCACEPVLVAVAGEEDGGLGAFAALERDADFDACVIPEPTGWDVVCAQAGALTFRGVVPGVAAHAAHKLEGVSAIDRYVAIHAALAEHERALNNDVADPLMRPLALPYPLLVGRIAGGEWSSSVPDRLTFEGRAPVRVGEDPDAVRAALRDVVARACPQARLAFDGGQFASGRTDPREPLVGRVREAFAAETGREPAIVGVPWGADLRLWTARGIATVMAGTPGIERAHGVDERVRVDDLATLARALARLLESFG